MNLATLGQRIRSQREKRRLTQAQLANTLHISAQAVSKWERGENAPDITMLQPLSNILDRSIEWILSGTEGQKNTFDATILYTSHRGFAHRAASTSPESVALWINGVFHTMTEAVLASDGVPVKYTGDGFLAYFSGKNHAERAVEAAKSCAESVAEKELLITLHTGSLYLGAMGHHEYAQPDIMGESVNTVFMMNRWATNSSNERILVSSAVKEAAPSFSYSEIKTGEALFKQLFVVS